MSNLIDMILEGIIRAIDWKIVSSMLTGALIPLFIARHMFKKQNRASRLKESRDACVVLIRELGDMRLHILQTMKSLGSADEQQSGRIDELRDKAVVLENQIMICRLISTDNVSEQLLLEVAASIQDIHSAIHAFESFNPTDLKSWSKKQEPVVAEVTLLLGRLVFKISDCFRSVKD